MTDEQILVELARRVMGWERDSEGYWDPFEDWDDAMALAEKWREGEFRSFSIGCGGVYYVTLLNVGEEDIKRSHGMDSSGPRAVTMAVARAAGIEVEG